VSVHAAGPIAAGSIALSVLFADLAVRGRRRAVVLGSLRVKAPARPARTLPSWLPIAAAALAGWWVAAIPGAMGCVVATVIARRMKGRRRAAREAAPMQEQLADAVRTIVSALRAGLSIPQALGYAARESQPPIADGLGILVVGLETGVPFDEAVDAWATHAGGEDARLVASVLRLNRRTGGDLPMVLDRVGDTLRERLAARRELRALTAQARLSGTILGVLPVAFFGVLWLTSRQDIQAALSSPAGLLSVALGLILEGAAFLWIRRLLEVR
jgi:tight adherence protein B